MTRKTISNLLFVAAVVLAVLFVIVTAVSWHRYTTILNSVPFRMIVMVHALELLLPGAVLAAIGAYLRRK